MRAIERSCARDA